MFSAEIVGSDVFVDMPMSAQALYFHLCLHADDDGFISRPKQIMRMVGANEDDLKILIAKRYILPFESGVSVVKHWLVHNLIRSDLYTETTYKKEKSTLGLNEFGAYTELRDGIVPLKQIEEPEWLKRRRSERKTTEVKPPTARQRTADVPKSALRLGKVRLGQVSIGKVNKDNNAAKAARVDKKDIDAALASWQTIIGMDVDSPGNRKAIAALLRKMDHSKLDQLINGVAQSHEDQYAPRISDFVSLKRKLNDLLVWGKKRNISSMSKVGVVE